MHGFLPILFRGCGGGLDHLFSQHDTPFVTTWVVCVLKDMPQLSNPSVKTEMGSITYLGSTYSLGGVGGGGGVFLTGTRRAPKNKSANKSRLYLALPVFSSHSPPSSPSSIYETRYFSLVLAVDLSK